jgi:nucleotide-binding universal stress UspA family protein
MNPPNGRRIVLATDLSARCDRAFDRAVLLAREWNARLTVVSALEHRHERLDTDPRSRLAQLDREKVDAECQVSSDLQRAGISADIIVRRGRAPKLILEAAQATRCDLIITGIARDLGLARSVVGATLEALTRRSAIPVLVVKQPAQEPYRSAVVGVGFTSACRAALQAAHSLFGAAQTTVLHAFRPPLERLGAVPGTDGAAYRHAVSECARFVADCLPGQAPGPRCVAEIGSLEPALNRYASDQQVDLIAVGSGPSTLVAAALFGSVSGSLIRSSPSDLLLVPPSWSSGCADTRRDSGEEPSLRRASA